MLSAAHPCTPRRIGAFALFISILLSGCGGGGSDGGAPPPPPPPPGTLDSSFGTNGVVQTPGVESQFSKAVLVQADGKIVAAGMTTLATPAGLLTNNFVAVRYAPNGSLDSGFGTAGIASVTVDTVAAPTGADEVWSTAFQPDGKIVVVGTSGGFDGRSRRCTLVRFNTDGSPDSSFGTAGLVIDPRPSATDCNRVVVQPDGKFVVADQAFQLRRLNQDGSPDLSFGAGGVAIPEPNPGKSDAILLQPDGKIVVIGWSTFLPPGLGPVLGSLAVWRVNSNGTPDPTFGDGSMAKPPGVDNTRSPQDSGGAIQPDGKIVIASNSTAKGLVRLNPDGSLDSAFSDGGAAPTGVTGLALQANGKIVLSGSTWPNYPNSPASEFTVYRFNSSGSADSGFGAGGKAHTPIGSYAWPTALAIQPDGRFVLVGWSKMSDPSQFILTLTRFFGDP